MPRKQSERVTETRNFLPPERFLRVGLAIVLVLFLEPDILVRVSQSAAIEDAKVIVDEGTEDAEVNAAVDGAEILGDRNPFIAVDGVNS